MRSLKIIKYFHSLHMLGSKQLNNKSQTAHSREIFKLCSPVSVLKSMTSTQQGKLSQVVTNLKAIHLQPSSETIQMTFPLLEKDVTPGFKVGILYNNY